MTNLAYLSITQLSNMFDAAELDAETLTRLFLDRAEGVGRDLNCYITLCKETALAEARAAQDRITTKRRRGKLDGIPVALKDNIDVTGIPTSNGFGGSPYRVPAADAEIVRRLRAAGAIILGKLNMHEGALCATTDNPHHGRTVNPHRAGHSPGGSSGGAGNSRRRRPLLCGARHRYRRLRAHTGVLLRRCRVKARATVSSVRVA